jgi:hypothetical protein
MPWRLLNRHDEKRPSGRFAGLTDFHPGLAAASLGECGPTFESDQSGAATRADDTDIKLAL